MAVPLAVHLPEVSIQKEDHYLSIHAPAQVLQNTRYLTPSRSPHLSSDPRPLFLLSFLPFALLLVSSSFFTCSVSFSFHFTSITLTLSESPFTPPPPPFSPIHSLSHTHIHTLNNDITLTLRSCRRSTLAPATSTVKFCAQATCALAPLLSCCTSTLGT